MDQRAAYLIQVLEKIGSPLMASITATITDEGGQESAKHMAALLTRSVQVSIDMANATELAATGVQDDSLRLALTALASPLVAGLFERNKKIPEDADLKKITTSLQAALSFAENFSPNQENTERLSSIAAQGHAVDAHQVSVQYIHALTPIINASASFSFGQSEQKLVMEITSALVAKASALRLSILGEMPENEQKQIDLAILRSLAEIYTACHEAETSRLMTMSDEERASQPQAPGGGLALDNVWKAFNLRITMLEILAQNTLPASKGSGSKPAAPPAPPAIEQPQATEIPSEQPAVQTPAAPVDTPPPAAPSAGSNPMSMFGAPKTDGVIPAETPPPAEQPPVTAAPTEQPQSVSPMQSTENTEGDKKDPMAFFTQKPKNDDES